MINRLKKLYPKYMILIKKNNILYDIHNNLIEESILKDINYIIIKDNSYEVHKKTKY